jgi:glycosyltransferase involved in cell wall biosynthesis
MSLSVVIPAHNEEGYLGACLASVLREAASSGLEVEIVVVDNASTDRTAEVALRYPGVTVVREPCKGLARARDAGLKASHGTLIVNMDADCIMPRGYLARVLRHFERTPRLACLSGPFIYYDLPQTAQISSAVFYLFQFFPNVLGQRIFGLGAIAQGGNYVVRRSMVEQAGGYDTSLIFYGEDTDIAIRLSRVGLVRFTMLLSMKSSARRLLREGVFRAGYLYTINNIFMIFRGRPLTPGPVDLRDSRRPRRVRPATPRSRAKVPRSSPS